MNNLRCSHQGVLQSPCLRVHRWVNSWERTIEQKSVPIRNPSLSHSQPFRSGVNGDGGFKLMTYGGSVDGLPLLCIRYCAPVVNRKNSGVLNGAVQWPEWSTGH